MHAFFRKHREVLMYLVFGVLTTLVSWIVYFGLFRLWKTAFSVPEDQTTSGMYLAGYTVSQVISWVCAVLFAFFTNRAWVFTEAEKNVPLFRQLCTFAGGRVLTFGLDYLVTYLGTLAMVALFPSLTAVALLGREWNVDELAAKFVAAVLVVIGNYIFSKLFVFRKKKENAGENGKQNPG